MKQHTYIIRWSTHLKVGRGLLYLIRERLESLPYDANVVRLYDRVPVGYLKAHLAGSLGILPDTESTTPSVTYKVYRKEWLSESLRRLDIKLARQGIFPCIPEGVMWGPSYTSGLLEDDMVLVITTLLNLPSSAASATWIKALRAKHSRLVNARLEKERKEREALVTRAFQVENELLASVFLKPGQG